MKSILIALGLVCLPAATFAEEGRGTADQSREQQLEKTERLISEAVRALRDAGRMREIETLQREMELERAQRSFRDALDGLKETQGYRAH